MFAPGGEGNFFGGFAVSAWAKEFVLDTWRQGRESQTDEKQCNGHFCTPQVSLKSALLLGQTPAGCIFFKQWIFFCKNI